MSVVAADEMVGSAASRPGLPRTETWGLRLETGKTAGHRRGSNDLRAGMSYYPVKCAETVRDAVGEPSDGQAIPTRLTLVARGPGRCTVMGQARNIGNAWADDTKAECLKGFRVRKKRLNGTSSNARWPEGNGRVGTEGCRGILDGSDGSGTSVLGIPHMLAGKEARVGSCHAPNPRPRPIDGPTAAFYCFVNGSEGSGNLSLSSPPIFGHQLDR
jgi:hypothetical protein